MKKVIIIPALILSFIISVSANDIEENTVLIKFKDNSEMYSQYKAGINNYNFPELQSILGNIKSKNFISASVIQCAKLRAVKLANKKDGISTYSTMHNSLIDSLNALSRIIEIKYSESIPPELAAEKLKSNPEIEYAEPKPVQHFFSTPNDPYFSNQYYLTRVNADKAWDLINTQDTVIVGIVDTGIDYNHEDLASSIFINKGETGLDANGNDKATNGIDDDGNGFVDDWRGWDFLSSTSASGQDNDPYPGHPHGTHVGGTVGAAINNSIGIAGVCKNVKLIPVKIGYDDPNSTSTGNGYDGILYAASMGASVINCSWGGSSMAKSEQSVITNAVNLGALIVAAAGNDSQNAPSYPAAYDGVMSVAATDENNRITYFSNYNTTVDISAPGNNVFATVPGNSYESMSGTSMASPIVSACAALLKLAMPQCTPVKLAEILKATADTSMYEINTSYKGLMGTGLVDVYNAIKNKDSAKAVNIENLTVKNADSGTVLTAGADVTINFNLHNLLKSVKNVKCRLVPNSAYMSAKNNLIEFGDLASDEVKAAPQSFTATLNSGLSIDADVDACIEISDDNSVIKKYYFTFAANPSYITVAENNISLTFNSAGNMAFSDFPQNSQGDGFKYKSSANMMFEGALMIGINDSSVSNCARGYNDSKSESFYIENLIKLKPNSSVANLEAYTKFDDSYNYSHPVGVEVYENIYQFNKDDLKNQVFVKYTVRNTNAFDFDSLFVGLYFDWDIGQSGANNIVDFDYAHNYGWVKNADKTNLPVAGAMLLSNQTLNYFAMDNNGNTEDNPGVYDDFTIQEKWFTMSNGIKRPTSSACDASMVISAGPIKLKQNETVPVVFCLFAGENKDSLDKAVQAVKDNHIILSADSGNLPALNENMLKIYPNPTETDNINVEISLEKSDYIKIELFDVSGKLIKQILPYTFANEGMKTFNFNLDNLSSGTYFIKLSGNDGSQMQPLKIIK